MLLKYNSVLKAITEQFLSKNVTFNCWKTNIHYSDMAQNLIIMNTHLKDADNILAQKKSARVFVHKNIQNDRWWHYQWRKNITTKIMCENAN